MNFISDIEGIFTKDEIEQFLKDEQNFYIEYVENNWLDRYFKIKAVSKRTQVPSIVSAISDTPRSSGMNISKTEQYAMKAIQASEWLDTLYLAVEELSPVEQKLIQLKYMKKRNDGSRYSDEVVYPELFIGKTRYYELKKEALEMLGRILYGVLAEMEYSS